MWSDIDHMDNYRDFTHDPIRFADLPSFIDELHQNHTHYVPILDAGVARRPWGNYSAYDDGVENDSFLKIGNNNEAFVG